MPVDAKGICDKCKYTKGKCEFKYVKLNDEVIMCRWFEEDDK